MCLHMKAFHNKCLVRKWRWNKRREYDLQKFTFGRCEYAIIATYQNQIVSICICLLVLCIAWLLVRFLMSLICLQGEEVRLGIYLRKENARPCSVHSFTCTRFCICIILVFLCTPISDGKCPACCALLNFCKACETINICTPMWEWKWKTVIPLKLKSHIYVPGFPPLSLTTIIPLQQLDLASSSHTMNIFHRLSCSVRWNRRAPVLFIGEFKLKSWLCNLQNCAKTNETDLWMYLMETHRVHYNTEGVLQGKPWETAVR